MSADKIEITHVEFGRAHINRLCRLDYVEWRRGGQKEFWNFASMPPYEVGEVGIFPPGVRVALALLVAPGLVEAVTKATEPPVKPVPDTRGQDTISDSKSIREGNPR